MNQAEFDWIAAHLKEAWEDVACARCRRNDWELAGPFVQQAQPCRSTPRAGDARRAGMIVELAMLTCRNCARVEWLDYGQLMRKRGHHGTL